MKTITVEFQGKGGSARAIGTFASLPGKGRVEWKGDIGQLIPELSERPAIYNACSFPDAPLHLAAKYGIATTVSETGEWEVFER